MGFLATYLNSPCDDVIQTNSKDGDFHCWDMASPEVHDSAGSGGDFIPDGEVNIYDYRLLNSMQQYGGADFHARRKAQLENASTAREPMTWVDANNVTQLVEQRIYANSEVRYWPDGKSACSGGGGGRRQRKLIQNIDAYWSVVCPPVVQGRCYYDCNSEAVCLHSLTPRANETVDGVGTWYTVPLPAGWTGFAMHFLEDMVRHIPQRNPTRSHGTLRPRRPRGLHLMPVCSLM